MPQTRFAPPRKLTEEFEPPSNAVSDGAAPPASVASTMTPRVEQALAILLESYDYAQDIGCPVWEFAVEIDGFSSLSLTASDWRWLCHKGLVEHARERTMHDEGERRFRHGGVLRLTRRTCFVLTADGQRFAREILQKRTARAAAVTTRLDSAPIERPEATLLDLPPLTPTWDRDRQQLRVGAAIVKEFKLPAPNQEMLLAAFHEENWPPRIDDPLPPAGEIDPKRRLHDTINSLNRNQKESLIRFLGDGSGQGVRWEFSHRSNGNGQH